jgi:hypothetical protein
MFIPMKTFKNLCYNGKSEGKRRNPARFRLFRLLRFARNDMDIAIIHRTDKAIRFVSKYLIYFASLAGDKREHPSIPYTLTPTPYRGCVNLSTIENNNLQGKNQHRYNI